MFLTCSLLCELKIKQSHTSCSLFIRVIIDTYLFYFAHIREKLKYISDLTPCISDCDNSSNVLLSSASVSTYWRLGGNPFVGVAFCAQIIGADHWGRTRASRCGILTLCAHPSLHHSLVHHKGCDTEESLSLIYERIKGILTSLSITLTFYSLSPFLFLSFILSILFSWLLLDAQIYNTMQYVREREDAEVFELDAIILLLLL